MIKKCLAICACTYSCVQSTVLFIICYMVEKNRMNDRDKINVNG